MLKARKTYFLPVLGPQSEVGTWMCGSCSVQVLRESCPSLSNIIACPTCSGVLWLRVSYLGSIFARSPHGSCSCVFSPFPIKRDINPMELRMICSYTASYPTATMTTLFPSTFIY